VFWGDFFIANKKTSAQLSGGHLSSRQNKTRFIVLLERPEHRPEPRPQAPQQALVLA
jgi:hypothetical protein